MKTLLLLFLVLAVPSVWAEGFLSMTDVTLENANKLDHHTLRVDCHSQQGTSYIALIVHPDKKHPFESCDVTIYDPSGEKRLVQVSPMMQSFHGGTRVYIHVADELVDRLEISYAIKANAEQSHRYIIRRGLLKQLVKPIIVVIED